MSCLPLKGTEWSDYGGQQAGLGAEGIFQGRGREEPKVGEGKQAPDFAPVFFFFFFYQNLKGVRSTQSKAALI